MIVKGTHNSTLPHGGSHAQILAKVNGAFGSPISTGGTTNRNFPASHGKTTVGKSRSDLFSTHNVTLPHGGSHSEINAKVAGKFGKS